MSARHWLLALAHACNPWAWPGPTLLPLPTEETAT